jgi:hypothetical protein
MQVISYIVCNSGDGSNHIEWFNRALTDDEIRMLEDSGSDSYISGDGIQYDEMYFPDEFSISGWAGMNFITFVDFNERISDIESQY